jgi:hypothetical protein
LVKGHWSGDNMAGPSSSDISCLKADKTCTDTSASIAVIGDHFVMNASTTEYKIERWTSQEIVAAVVGDEPCRLRQVLKADRVGKRVTWMVSLSEPLDANLSKLTRDFCTKAEMHLELKEGIAWKMR